MGRETTVLILGGGIAGLAAARELSCRGFKVTVLEAQARLGGRIRTLHEAGRTPVELGAEFIHGKSPALWRRLEQIPLSTHEVSATHWVARPDGSLATYPIEKQVAKVTQQIELDEPDESFDQFLARQALGKDVNRSALDYVEGFHAADPRRFSTHGLAAAEGEAQRIHGDELYRITEGYDALVHGFEKELLERNVKLLFNAEAQHIRWRPGRVLVQTLVGDSMETFQATAVIVTLPLGVLKARCVQFEPVLEEKDRAIAGFEVGHVTKLILQFRQRFWPEDLNFIHTFDEWLPTWWTTADPLTLTAWAGGPRGARCAEARCEFLVERTEKILGRIFSKSPEWVRGQLEQIHTHNWREDPFCRMAYSYLAVDHEDAPRRLAEPIGNTLFFAGEATSLNAQNGTVHGALETGLRAADEVQRLVPLEHNSRPFALR